MALEEVELLRRCGAARPGDRRWLRDTQWPLRQAKKPPVFAGSRKTSRGAERTSINAMWR